MIICGICNKYVSTFRMFCSVLQAWLKTRSPQEKKIFHELFEGSFLKIYTWTTQNLQLTMEVLQCNIIQQMIYILDGLVPVLGENEQEAAVSTTGSLDGILHVYVLHAKCSHWRESSTTDSD